MQVMLPAYTMSYDEKFYQIQFYNALQLQTKTSLLLLHTFHSTSVFNFVLEKNFFQRCKLR